MKYKCLIEGCDYETDNRSLIDFHHKTPRECDPRSSNKLVIPVCPSCHRKIYHPLAKTGMHSRLSDESLEIINIVESTAGKVLIYKECNTGIEHYVFIRSKNGI